MTPPVRQAFQPDICTLKGPAFQPDICTLKGPAFQPNANSSGGLFAAPNFRPESYHPQAGTPDLMEKA
jgi:hypothetical protein